MTQSMSDELEDDEEMSRFRVGPQARAQMMVENAFTRTWRGGITINWNYAPMIFTVLHDVMHVFADNQMYQLDCDQYRFQCIQKSLIAISQDKYEVVVGDKGMIPKSHLPPPPVDHFYHNQRCRRILPPAYYEFLKTFGCPVHEAEYMEVFVTVATNLGVC